MTRLFWEDLFCFLAGKFAVLFQPHVNLALNVFGFGIHFFNLIQGRMLIYRSVVWLM